MNTETFLLLILIIVLLGVVPAWPHSKSWGYAPSGVLTLLLVVFLIWALAGNRPLFRSAGHNLKDAGRDVADSVRRTVQ